MFVCAVCGADDTVSFQDWTRREQVDSRGTVSASISPDWSGLLNDCACPLQMCSETFCESQVNVMIPIKTIRSRHRAPCYD